MNTESLPRYVHDTEADRSPEDHERIENVSYKEYREACDSVKFFRRIGVLEQYEYEEALMDARTSFLVKDGRALPVLVPLVYEDRYNREKSKEMTGAQEVYLLALPCLEIQKAVDEGAVFYRSPDMEEDFSIIVEDYDPDGFTDKRKTEIAKTLEAFGELQPGEFVDERLISLPDNRTSWMAIYDLVMDSNRKPEEIIREGTAEERAVRAWEQYRVEHGLPELPDENFDGNFFFTARQLRDHPEIVDQLWGISEVGFGNNLGLYHPMSMAVTKHFFDEHVTSEGTFVCAKYDKGEPMCFGFVAPSMDHNDWLNSESPLLKELNEKIESGEETVVHFFELISRGERGLGLAPSILTLLQDLASRMGERTRVVFESTNLSDLYIPKAAEATAQHNALVEVAQPVVKRDELNYWYLKEAA